MKILQTLGLLLFLVTLLITQAQTQSKPHFHNTPSSFCQTMEILDQKKQANSNLQTQMLDMERSIQKIIHSSKSRSSLGVITIPVVFHVLYNDEATNISNEQILSQLKIINADFRGRNKNRGNTPDVFKEVEADSEIEFCLANIDPNGYRTSGITRTNTYHKNFWINGNGFDLMKFDNFGGRDAWPSDQYLNVWVVNAFDGGLLGYAQFPGGPPETDGVVVDYRFFGARGTAAEMFPIFSGRTLTHEIGHWLFLSHIWGDLFGDGDCTSDDNVADTPLQDGPNGGYAAPCNFPGRNSCDEGEGDLPDMFQNYMDYSNDECYTMFTKGQKARMRALFEPGGPRESLLHSKGCGSGLALGLAPNPRCNDGIRNGNETGVDCGGVCDPCPEAEYCLSVGDIPFVKWIESISVGGADIITYENVSGPDFGYGDYSDEMITLTPGNEYAIGLNTGSDEFFKELFGFDFKNTWSIFIDFNNNDNFEDEGELIYSSGYPSFDTQIADDGSRVATFTVPSDASGSARMRVVLKILFLDFDLSSSCGAYSIGETEDYTISYADCSAPSNISGRVFGEDIIVNWDPVLSATEYQIRYTENGSWKTAICPGTSFTLANAPSGSYIFEVRARCNGGLSMASKQVNISVGGIGSSSHRITDTRFNTTNNELGILQVFPNPTSTSITVTYQTTNEQAVLEVKDILGRTVYQRLAQNVSNQVSTIDVSALTNGIYYLSLYDGERVVTKKFVKE